jgi:chromosome segregation protein
MRLKRLELFGFKSFADRTVFEFGDHTLTGVVGPNGCGKSNVVDSVRWVLGEQRPTSMRGAEMTDVIFKGSTSRPPLSVAEVTLILDNAVGRLSSRGAEVSITRRVFKSGEGEYLIDGDAVRLKDVREMLFDTGLGSRGYAVLEQGRIDAVLSANPLERRRIFEEAAGISRYRQRKVEAELRLKRVADDMARLDDLLGELGTRVRSLRIQAGKAERFVAAREEWAREKARLFRHRLWIAGRELEALSKELAQLEASFGRVKGERARLEERAGTLERQRASLLSEIERQSAEASRLSGDGRALDERRAHLSAKIAGLEKDSREESERASRLESALAERAAELARLDGECTDLKAEVERLAAAEEERSDAHAQAERAAEERRYGQERGRAEALAALSDLNQAENRARSLSEARDLSRARAERARGRLEEAHGAETALAAEAGMLEGEARATESARARSDEARRDLERSLEENAVEAQRIDGEREALAVERARVQSRIEFLLDRERDLEELSEAARALFEGAGSDAGPCAPEELFGLVADHLRTDTLHARALDAALAARGRALVARDRAAAVRVAGWLKARERGQVGLLLGAGLAAVRGKSPPAPRGDDAGLVQGRLLERVQCTAGCEPLTEILIGDVFLARDLTAALALAERHPDLRFVTLDGDLADAAGLLAGSGALTQGAVGRRSSAAEMAGDLERLSASIRGLEEARLALSSKKSSLEEERGLLGARLEEAVAARADAESRLATARARLSDLAQDCTALERESAGASSEVVGLEQELAAEEHSRSRTLERHGAAQAALARLAREVAELEVARESAAAGAAEARVQAARARERLDGMARRRGDLAAVLDENRAEMERARRLSLEHAEAARASRGEVEAAARESARLQEERGRIEERLRGLRERDEHEREAALAARGGVDALQRDLDVAGQVLSDQRLAEQRLSLARQEILRRAAEELSQDEGALVTGFQPEEDLATAAALDALEVFVKDLKERLDKLGPVNMEAMAELSDVGGRLDFLQKQRDDLSRARDALTSTLLTIDVESKRLFLETFEAVRENFQRIFRQLFGGGRADVSLEEGADVLDAGVEIVARPPGRELLPIGLLSGGQRTLTALALLFAVFEARPSPFCILDEVDAALDDANVERFLSMLDGFRKSTQFIVVTHNKGTMAACQGLYGVTMETKGVSRQVAVQLDEAERWTAPEAPASANGGPAPDGARTDTSSGEEPGEPSIEATLDAETGEPLVEIRPQAKGVEPERAEPAAGEGPRRSTGRRSGHTAGEPAPEALD